MNIPRLAPHLIALALAAFTVTRAVAEDWGVYHIVPASAQALVLEAVDGGRAEGTLVSINKPADSCEEGRIVRAACGTDLVSVTRRAPDAS